MSVNDEGLQPSSDSFWEVGQYKRTVKRIEDSNRLCNDLMALIQERSDIEKMYAKNLRQWARKWNEHIKSGPEYGTTEGSWNGVTTEAERLSELHLEVKSQLMNEVHASIKHWQKENFHKNMVGTLKESKDMEDLFRRAQKPWAKKLTKVCKCKKDYHGACKAEKSAKHQQSNAKGDASVTPEQVKKLSDKVDKCEREVELTRDKYKSSLSDLNAYNSKYIEEMKEVFDQCQDFEEKRIKYFKEMLFGIHKCLNISDNPEFSGIYGDLYNTISNTDHNLDLKWWSQMHGVDMAMNWPTFDEYSPEVKHTITDKRSKSIMNRNTGGDGITLMNMTSHDRQPSYVSDTGSDNASYNAKQEYTKDYVAKTQSAAVHHQPPASNSTTSPSINPQNPFGDELEVEYDLTDDGSAGVPVRALYDYAAVEHDELDFKIGDIFVKLTEEDSQGWCKGRKDDRIGLYPANYVEPVN